MTLPGRRGARWWRGAMELRIRLDVGINISLMGSMSDETLDRRPLVRALRVPGLSFDTGGPQRRSHAGIPPETNSCSVCPFVSVPHSRWHCAEGQRLTKQLLYR
jgi:hypothetical protein